MHVPTRVLAIRVMQEQLPRCTNAVEPWMAMNGLNIKKGKQVLPQTTSVGRLTNAKR